MKYLRCNTEVSAEVEVKAEDYWNMLVENWEDFQPWLTAAGKELPVIESYLMPGSQRGAFPRTRMIHMPAGIGLEPAKGTGTDPYLYETLVFADKIAMTMLYRVDGVGPFNRRNYLATTTIDDLGNGKCKITIRSRYDVPEEYEKAMYDMTVPFHEWIINNGAESCRVLAKKKKK